MDTAIPNSSSTGNASSAADRRNLYHRFWHTFLRKLIAQTNSEKVPMIHKRYADSPSASAAAYPRNFELTINY
jgi:hypothetical protein